MLPKDFPKGRHVHAYFQIWSDRQSAMEMMGDAKENLKNVKNVLVAGSYGKIVKERSNDRCTQQELLR